MVNEIEIDSKLIGLNHKPYIIAELSANHNGSLERALKTIEEAHICGADAIKIQTYTADSMTIDCDRDDFMVKGGLWDGYKLYDLYKWAHTPYEWHKPMFDFARELGITMFSTPFDENAVDLLEELEAPAYKIASFENTDLPLIEKVAKTGKPMIVSTGMATEAEIEDVVSTARRGGCKDLILLHCISSYPAPINQANISQVSVLAKKFNVISGLSDHTLGTVVSVAAVAQGACIIEKHFILSRDEKGPDSEFSIEPHELKRLCHDARDARLAIGVPKFSSKEAESSSKVFRRSIYFVRDLPAGAIVSSEDIRRIRPGMGLPPKFFNDIVGKKLKLAVERGMPTSWEHFDE
jgi:pseudaminic acid synthase